MRGTIDPRSVMRFPKLFAWQDLSAAYLERKHVLMALDAGFSEDEVRYMLALPEERALVVALEQGDATLTRKAEAEGEEAFRKGVARHENPYPPDSDDWMNWMDGLDQASSREKPAKPETI